MVDEDARVEPTLGEWSALVRWHQRCEQEAVGKRDYAAAKRHQDRRHAIERRFWSAGGWERLWGSRS